MNKKVSNLLNYSIIGIALAGSFPVLNLFFRTLPSIIVAYDNNFLELIKVWSTEDRLILISKCLFLFGIFLFTLTMLTMIMRVSLSKSTPLLGAEDPIII